MQQNKSSCIGTIGLIVCLILLVTFILPVSASAVTVGPVKLEYNVDPGATISGEFYIKNDEKETKVFAPLFEKFTEQDGKKIFYRDEESTIGMWIDTTRSVTLGSGQEIKVPFTLNVPSNAPPGGHYAVVWWSAQAGEDNGDQVAVVTRAGILVYLNVSGEERGSASIKSFGTEDDKIFFWKRPSSYSFKAVISNDSNMYIKPAGEVSIKSIFGKVKASTSLNAKGYQILSDSGRTIEDIEIAPERSLFGIYKAEASMTYGTAGKASNSSWLFILPWNLLLLIIIIILIILIGGPMALRRYNNYILSKYQK